MRLITGLLAAAIVLAGCAGSDRTGSSDDEQVEVRPWINPNILSEEGHDHADPSSHDIANNMSLVGHHPLGDDGPPGSISEIDVAGDHAFLGVMGFGFQIVDISNMSAPELVASVEITSTDHMTPLGVYLADLKVDDAGDWLFIALELSTNPGVLIYDVRDKANPVLAGFWPEPGLLLGCHMVEYARIGEGEYVFCAPLDNAVYVGQLLPPVGSTREIVQVARWMPTTPKFVQQQGDVATGYVEGCDHVSSPTCIANVALHLVSGHQDMTWQKDPLTGVDMLSVSFWNLGLRFVDVSNPLLPQEIGSWAGEDSQKWDGVLHTSMMFESNGSRIAVANPEGARPPAMFVLDATDFDNPKVLAEWTALPDYMGEDGRFSLHNFQIVDGKVYMAHYHGGLWVLDISTPELQASPRAVGTFMPWDRAGGDVDSPRYGAGCCGGSWDVVVWKGHVLSANDGGLFIAALDGDPLGDEHYNGFA